MTSRAVPKRVLDTTQASRQKREHERYRRHHPEPKKDSLGIREGTTKAFMFSCLVSGGTASDIARRTLETFPDPNMTEEKMRFRVLQYVHEFRSKHKQIISTTGQGKDLVYKLEKQ